VDGALDDRISGRHGRVIVRHVVPRDILAMTLVPLRDGHGLEFCKSARRTRGITLNRRRIIVHQSTSQSGRIVN
jgi:hypothetical protein